MAQTARFLQLIRFKASPSSSSLSPSRFPFSAKLDSFHSLTKSLEAPSLRIRILSSNWKSYVQRYIHKSNICNSGSEFSMGRLCGMSIVVGSVGLWPRYASSMDVYETSPDDHRTSFGASDSDENPPAILILVKKLLVPIVLLYIVWMNWGHPAIIAAKAILILLSTKPSPLSVYVLIDKWQRQYKDQHPLLYKFKSLYAKKVEVEDYTFLCVARVEVNDQKFTLIGIMGGWWVFERTSMQGTFSSFKNRATEILKTAILL